MKSAQTEERILKETGELFFKHGIRTMTMDDIASSLGISKKTIYVYFRDKDELIKSFTDSELTCQKNIIYEIRKVSSDAIDEILKAMVHLGNYFNTVNPAVFYDLQKYYPKSWEAFRVFREKILIAFVEENLKKGIQQKYYREELKVKILARLRIEELEIGFNPKIFPPNQYKIAEVQLALIDHFLYGIVTLKGYELINKYKRIQKNNFRAVAKN